ncbi:MAG: tyrosine--tRNA ligase, partial [Nitrospira sp.]|nr:tyrosine--tRNA ligase [Nitrospira sp.]
FLSSSSKAQVLSMPVVDVLMLTGLIPSKGEARRLLAQHAIQWDGEKLTDPNGHVTFEQGRPYPVKIGKRKFAIIRVEP